MAPSRRDAKRSGAGASQGFWGKLFSFDVELEWTAAGKGEHLIERGDVGARHGDLAAEAMVSARSAVAQPNLFKGKFTDDTASAGPVAHAAVEQRIVGNHQHVIDGDDNVELDEISASLDRTEKSSDRVFR